MIEEQFRKDDDDEDDLGLPPTRPDSTIEAAQELDEEAKTKMENENSKEDRI